MTDDTQMRTARRLLQRRSGRVAVLLLCVLTGTTAVGWARAPHENKRDERRQVELVEEQLRQAELTGDVAAMDRLLSDDFVGISMHGEVNTKAQMLERLQSRALVLSKIQLDDTKIKLLGGVAVVTSRADVMGRQNGASCDGHYRYTRVYLHQPNGGWKVTNFEITKIPG